MNYLLFILPLAGAFIGWAINSLAIRILFQPYQPKKIFGFSVQGILPKKQPQLAQRIGQFADAEFDAVGMMQEKIADPVNLEKIMPLVEKNVDDFLRVKLGKEMPVISMFIGNKTIDSLKKIFMQEIEALFPQVMGQFAANLKTELDIGAIVTKKIAAIPPEKLEKLVREGLAKELRTVRMLGAATGLIIGVVQALIFLLIR